MRAHTDNVQPGGTSAWRASSNGGWASSSETCTVTGTSAAAAGVGDCVGAGISVDVAVGLVECVAQALTTATPISAAPIPLCCSQTRMHLPNQDLSGFGGGDALTAGCGEPHRIAFMQRTRSLEGHLAARHEQVQIGSLGQLHALAGLQARTVQRGVAVTDGDGGLAAVFWHTRRNR